MPELNECTKVTVHQPLLPDNSEMTCDASSTAYGSALSSAHTGIDVADENRHNETRSQSRDELDPNMVPLLSGKAGAQGSKVTVPDIPPELRGIVKEHSANFMLLSSLIKAIIKLSVKGAFNGVQAATHSEILGSVFGSDSADSSNTIIAAFGGAENIEIIFAILNGLTGVKSVVQSGSALHKLRRDSSTVDNVPYALRGLSLLSGLLRLFTALSNYLANDTCDDNSKLVLKIVLGLGLVRVSINCTTAWLLKTRVSVIRKMINGVDVSNGPQMGRKVINAGVNAMHKTGVRYVFLFSLFPLILEVIGSLQGWDMLSDECGNNTVFNVTGIRDAKSGGRPVVGYMMLVLSFFVIVVSAFMFCELSMTGKHSPVSRRVKGRVTFWTPENFILGPAVFGSKEGQLSGLNVNLKELLAAVHAPQSGDDAHDPAEVLKNFL